MNAGYRLILVRHGVTEWSAQRRYQGQLPVPLIHAGIKQARSLAEELQQYRPKGIRSSDLLRALQTAEILAKYLHIPMHLDARLRELDCGAWAGLTESEIEALYPQAFAELHAGHDIPRGAGETMAQVLERIRAGVSEWIGDKTSSPLVIVSHAYALRAMLQILLGETLEDRLHLPLGSYTVLMHEKGRRWVLERYAVVPGSDDASEVVQWIPGL